MTETGKHSVGDPTKTVEKRSLADVHRDAVRRDEIWVYGVRKMTYTVGRDCSFFQPFRQKEMCLRISVRSSSETRNVSR